MDLYGQEYASASQWEFTEIRICEEKKEKSEEINFLLLLFSLHVNAINLWNEF